MLASKTIYVLKIFDLSHRVFLLNAFHALVLSICFHKCWCVHLYVYHIIDNTSSKKKRFLKYIKTQHKLSRAYQDVHTRGVQWGGENGYAESLVCKHVLQPCLVPWKYVSRPLLTQVENNFGNKSDFVKHA